MCIRDRVGREVKTVNKKCLFAVVIVLVSLICLSACGALRDTADKNKALNEMCIRDRPISS